jgi:hypothetical protein
MRRQAILALLVVAAACGNGTQGPTGTLIDREVFIDTYVDLRLAAIQSPDFAVTPERREEILRARGVDADALLRFADAHGRDPDYMSGLWSEVEERLTARRSAAEAGILP